MSEITGIFQSDLILKSALEEGIADLRRNPWLFRYIFASLLQDDLTKGKYGSKEVERAQTWFMKTVVPVFLSAKAPEKPVFPCLTIGLQSSVETEDMLADIHYQPQEDLESRWPALSRPFTPVSYSPVTGIMTVPDAVADELVISDGMVVFARDGTVVEIVDVPERNRFQVAIGSIADFTDAVIKGQRPAYVVTIESVSMKEGYLVGCHVHGEADLLVYLHSIVVFILLRSKQDLLEARGYERSTISSSDFLRNGAFDTENVFSRVISINGYVRQSWPKRVLPKFASVSVGPIGISQRNRPGIPTVPIEPDPNSEEGWMEMDSLTLKI